MFAVDWPWDFVDDAKRSEVEAVMCPERYARIKAQPEFTSYQRIGKSAQVLARIDKDMGLDLQDGRCAKTRIAPYLHYVYSVMGFEPNAVVVDDAYDRNGYSNTSCRDGGHAVKGAVGRSV